MHFPKRVETERLLLRLQQESDAEEIFARYAGDPAVTRYMTWTPHETVGDTIAYLKQKADRPYPSYNWLILSRSNGALLGAIGARVLEEHLVQFGYCLARDSWGHGYATEAAGVMVPVWLSHPAIWRVQAFCDPTNVASARVLEKVGLTREGLLRHYIRNPNISEVPGDVYCYARVREN